MVVLVAAVSGVPVADGRRTAEAVKKECTENARKIKKTKEQLNNNAESTRRSVAELQLVEAQIKRSNSNIARLEARGDSLEARLAALADSVAATEQRIAQLQQAYGKALRARRSSRQASSAAAYIFSSESFTGARKRMRYLDELRAWQAEKARELAAAKTRLGRQSSALDSAHVRLKSNIDNLDAGRRELADQKRRSDAVVAKLKREGKQLKSALEQQQKQARRLDDELNRIIDEEARAAAEAARRRQQGGNKPGTPAARPEGKPSTFAAAKGRLPMPVSGTSIIVSEFGRHTHRDYEKVETVNNGIDIEAMPDARALAVYDGVVTMITRMDGFHNVVLVRHGEYLTVYAGITDLAVHKGQEVKAGQTLGKLYSDASDGGRTRLHFEVRHEKDKLNPTDWLR